MLKNSIKCSTVIFMTSCLYKYYYYVSTWELKFFFFLILPYRKNYSCKDYLIFAIIPFHQVFILSQFFSGMFYGHIPIFYFIYDNKYFSCIWTEYGTVSSIAYILFLD